MIRMANVADASGIARVHIDSWRTTYRGIVPQAYLDSLDYSERASRWAHILSASASTNAVYVAENPQNGIVGFASGGPERSGDPVFRGELYAIYVLPNEQRRGLGTQLTLAVVDHLIQTGLDSMLVWVLAANEGARRFYERMGGRYVRAQTVEIGGTSLEEVAYGWRELSRARSPLAAATLPRKSIAVGAVITDGAGSILLVRPSYKGGRWDLPGGVVDQSEDLMSALERELSEEIAVQPVDPVLTGIYHTHPQDTLQVIFRTSMQGEPVADGREVVEWRFVPVQEIESLTHAWIMDRVLDALEFSGRVAVRAQRVDATGRRAPARARPWGMNR